MKQAALYFRVSTKAQGENDRLGLPVQLETVKAYCRTNGYKVVGTFEDRASGANAERPGLTELIAASAEGTFDTVVVYRWDRLARDVMLDGYIRYLLHERGVEVLSATEGSGADEISKLTQTILAAVARYERHLISFRLASARRKKAREGGYAHGRPPYGFRSHSGRLVADDREQEALAVARLLRRQRNSFGRIARELNARGFKPRSGKEWARSTVAAILSRTKRRNKPAA